MMIINILFFLSWAMSLILAFFIGIHVHTVMCQRAKQAMFNQGKELLTKAMEGLKNGRSRTDAKSSKHANGTGDNITEENFLFDIGRNGDSDDFNNDNDLQNNESDSRLFGSEQDRREFLEQTAEAIVENIRSQ